MSRELYQELIRLKKLCIESNEDLKMICVQGEQLPPRYDMNKGCIQLIDYLLEEYKWKSQEK